MQKFIPGQRWVSETEPELGLGLILEVGFREVKILFKAAEMERIYMHRNAPLRRVQLRSGERARARDGHVFIIQNVQEKNGLLTYLGNGEKLIEQDLLDSLSFSDPDKRLLAAQVSKNKVYELRRQTHLFRSEMLGSSVRGLTGGRVDLLEHQIYIAHTASSRHRPRLLLADEVGLGKTIEAGLIFHRLFVTGVVSRVLVVTPSQLVHQWLVELYRRFHHMFAILDEDLCRAEEKGDKRINPFMQRQLILCPIDFLAASPRRVEQAVAAGVDLLIVDEAHHLQWSPKAPSPEYKAIEALAQLSPGVLLLTATPIQLGQEGHFGRLRLLDPDRFSDFEKYLKDAEGYAELAKQIHALMDQNGANTAAADALEKAYPQDRAVLEKLKAYREGQKGSRAGLIADLIDRHGTGRLLFRNRRAIMTGFPQRIVEESPLDNGPEHQEFTRLVLAGSGIGNVTELTRYLNGPAAYTVSDLPRDFPEGSEFLRQAWRKDPRLPWLVGLLQHLAEEKILLLCSHKNTVFALQEILPTLITASFTSFHENMTLSTRDKNAAYFANPEGARLLICSEIGSEGRNFQFAHHVVLFDLPINPSVLEQRIGRLDRIGQLRDIHIHVPYIRGTAHELLYRWYAEGLNAFQIPLLGSDYFFDAQGSDLREECRLAMEAEINGAWNASFAESVQQFLQHTQTLAAEVRQTLEAGRDRLLELNSCKPEVAQELIAEIEAADVDPKLENYMESVFEHYGVDVDTTVVERGHFVFPGPQMFIDTFPCLPEDGLPITYDREEALIHEDLAFITLDHPMVRASVDLILQDMAGTVAFVEWKNAPSQGFALEAIFLLEATAPGHLHLDRFLPPTPIRLLVNQKLEALTQWLPKMDQLILENAPTLMIEEQHSLFEAVIPKMLKACSEGAAILMANLKKESYAEAEKMLGSERDRLKDLQSINANVSQTEIVTAEKSLQEILQYIRDAELRLDAVRLVLMR